MKDWTTISDFYYKHRMNPKNIITLPDLQPRHTYFKVLYYKTFKALAWTRIFSFTKKEIEEEQITIILSFLPAYRILWYIKNNPKLSLGGLPKYHKAAYLQGITFALKRYQMQGNLRFVADNQHLGYQSRLSPLYAVIHNRDHIVYADEEARRVLPMDNRLMENIRGDIYVKSDYNPDKRYALKLVSTPVSPAGVYTLCDILQISTLGLISTRMDRRRAKSQITADNIVSQYSKSQNADFYLFGVRDLTSSKILQKTLFIDEGFTKYVPVPGLGYNVVQIIDDNIRIHVRKVKYKGQRTMKFHPEDTTERCIPLLDLQKISIECRVDYDNHGEDHDMHHCIHEVFKLSTHWEDQLPGYLKPRNVKPAHFIIKDKMALYFFDEPLNKSLPMKECMHSQHNILCILLELDSSHDHFDEIVHRIVKNEITCNLIYSNLVSINNYLKLNKLIYMAYGYDLVFGQGNINGYLSDYHNSVYGRRGKLHPKIKKLTKVVAPNILLTGSNRPFYEKTVPLVVEIDESATKDMELMCHPRNEKLEFPSPNAIFRLDYLDIASNKFRRVLSDQSLPTFKWSHVKPGMKQSNIFRCMPISINNQDLYRNDAVLPLIIKKIDVVSMDCSRFYAQKDVSDSKLPKPQIITASKKTIKWRQLKCLSSTPLRRLRRGYKLTSKEIQHIVCQVNVGNNSQQCHYMLGVENKANLAFTYLKEGTKPTYLSRSMGIALVEGSHIKLNCRSVIDYRQALEYTWFLNGKELEDQRYRTIEIESLSEATSGEYKCLGRHYSGEHTQIGSTYITVKKKHFEHVNCYRDVVAYVRGRYRRFANITFTLNTTGMRVKCSMEYGKSNRPLELDEKTHTLKPLLYVPTLRSMVKCFLRDVYGNNMVCRFFLSVTYPESATVPDPSPELNIDLLFGTLFVGLFLLLAGKLFDYCFFRTNLYEDRVGINLTTRHLRETELEWEADERFERGSLEEME
ncbi:hypothetical protein SNEBB_011133 [Seison nebaliae]|nr:hypothetical protein SNEBB_011133 [Seison nebaliae]